MIWTVEDARLRVRLGIARSVAEVFDAAQQQFRVELAGGGTMVGFDVPAGARQPASVRFLNYTFVRIP